MHKDITAFINNPNPYSKGLDLLKTQTILPVSKVIIDFLEGTPTEFTRNKLVAELQKVLDAAAPPKQVQKIAPIKINPKTDKPINRSRELSIIDNKIKDTYAKLSHLHGKLIAATTDEERLTLAKAIQDGIIVKKLAPLWNVRDHLLETGQLLPLKQLEIALADLPTLMHKKQLYTNYVYRNKNKPHKKQEYTELLDEVNQAIDAFQAK